MKKLLLLSTFAFGLFTFSLAQQYGWQDISANVPGSPDFSDVFFVSDDEGWMSVSSGPEIYHTTDGGATFEIQETSLGTSTAAIYMIDENEGYTGGGSGFVYRTLDGGANWNLLGAISSSLNNMDFASADQGYACGDNGAVFSITQQEVTNLNSGLAAHLSGISAPSVDNVWVCGGVTISYFNGTSFEYQAGNLGTYNSLFFIDDNEGWAVGNSGLISHTEDGGEIWHKQINPDPWSKYDVFFLDENIGWAVGSNGTILKTTNGGDTWELDEEGSSLTTDLLTGIHFTSPTNGYVVGNGKTLLKYGELSGIGDEQQQNNCYIEVWPNPTHGKFQISNSIPSTRDQIKLKTQNSTFKIEVVDLFGQVIESNNNRTIEQLNNGGIWMDISKCPAGIYFIRIHFEDQLIVKKMIKL